MNNPRPVPPPQGAVGQPMMAAGGAPGMGLPMKLSLDGFSASLAALEKN